jgi:hypothetical protein
VVAHAHLGTTFFQGVLDRLYDDFESLDTSDFREAEEQRYSRARQQQDRHHLVGWFAFDGLPAWSRGRLAYSMTASITYRYHPEADALSQARILSSTDQFQQWLESWDDGLRSRTVPGSFQIVAVGRNDRQWLAVEHTFQLLVNRG